MGKIYGRLRFIEMTGTVKRRQRLAKFVCICGTDVTAPFSDVKGGRKRSCGCLARELAGKRMRAIATTHGMSYRSEYVAWADMIQRCHNPSNGNFIRYGARGISVCNEWRESLLAFFRHIGEKPSPVHSFDRIDNEGGYEPGNVRWATRSQQMVNRRKRTHCKYGHPFASSIIRIRQHGKYSERVCGECERRCSMEKYYRSKMK